jgi:hypothetical protein
MKKLFYLFILTFLPFGLIAGVPSIAQASILELSDSDDSDEREPATRLSEYEDENGKTWFAINTDGVLSYQKYDTISGWVRAARGDFSDRNFVPYRAFASKALEMMIPTATGPVRVSLEKNDPLRLVFILREAFGTISGSTVIPIPEDFVTEEDGESSKLTISTLRED